MNDTTTRLTVLKWAARITAGMSMGMLGMFVIGNMGQGAQAPTVSEAIGLLCFPVSVLIGLGLAFWKERTGAIVALSGFVAFHVWHLWTSGGLPGGVWFALFTSPAALFLWHDLASRQSPSDRDVSPDAPRMCPN